MFATPSRVPLRAARALGAALVAFQLALSAQTPPPRDPTGAGSLLVLIEVGDAGAHVLGVSAKDEPWVQRAARTASRLALTLRDGGGAALATAEVDVPVNHGLCRLSPQVGADPNGDRWLVTARVPDLGDAVAQIDFRREIDANVRWVARVPASELRATAPAGGLTIQTIKTAGSTATKFDIVILGDGYLANQQSTFDVDAAELVTHLFATIEPYRTYQSYFNVHTVLRVSNALVTQNSQGSPLSAYGAVLTTPTGMLPLGAGGLNQALLDAIQAPDVETGAVLILANAPNRYGGIAGFNQYGMGTTNRTALVGTDPRLRFPQIMEHELGHGYANLHDEYVTQGGGFDNPSNPDHPEANVTNRPGSPPLKWNYWANRLTPPGAFVGGAGFQGGVWHPDTNCMMNFLDNAHCAVCREEIVRRTYSVGQLSPMANPTPASTSISLSDLNYVDLAYTDATPTGGRYEWWIDGVQLTNTGVPITTNLRVFGAVLGYGMHTVEARIFDKTLEVATNPNSEFVRRDPNDVLRGTRTWNIDVQPPTESLRLSYERGNTNGLFAGVGRSLAVLGDIDLDGTTDLAYGTNAHVQVLSGATRQVLGQRSVGSVGTAPAPFVAGVGFLDSDTYPDVAIGTPGTTNKLELCRGPDLTHLYFLSPPVSGGTTFGGDVAALGRIDGDARDDFAVAWEGAAPAVAVYAGNNGSLIRTHAAPAGASGAVTTTAIPDLNADGKRELVVTFQRAGGTDVFVFSGGTGGTLASFTQAGEVYESAAAIDIIDDGIAELVFGAPTFQSNRGRVRCFAINLATQTLASLVAVDGMPGDYYYGRSVASAGDFDMDTANDFLVGCPGLPKTQFNPGTYGRIEVISGRTGTPITTRVEALEQGSQFGIAVANFGDTDEDGLADIAVGSPLLGLSSDGAVRVYSPAARTLSASVGTISTGAGGTQALAIDMPAAFAGQSYLVLGSVTGNIPGQPIGDKRVPLINDWYFGLTLSGANTGIYVNTAGTLDASGDAAPSIVVPPGLLVGLEGLLSWHAALVMSSTAATGSTNAVPLRLVQ